MTDSSGPQPTAGGRARLVDTHTHVLSPDTVRYPRAAPVGDPSDAWHDKEPVTTETLLARMDGTGIDAALLVQAMSTYGTDNRYVLDSARAHPGRCAAVGGVHLDDEEPAAKLRRMVTVDGGQGVRLFLGSSPTSALADSRLASVLEVALDTSVPVVLAVSNEQMYGLPPVIERFADVVFALDHCGFPVLDTGSPWPKAGALFDLVALPNLFLKVSSMTLQAAALGGPPAAFLERLVEAFGAERLMWGSDFPHTSAGGYAGLLTMARTAAAGLARPDQDRLFGGTALTIWPSLA